MQAYQETKEDQHPIVIICARDILEVLRASGINTDDDLNKWLSAFLVRRRSNHGTNLYSANKTSAADYRADRDMTKRDRVDSPHPRDRRA